MNHCESGCMPQRTLRILAAQDVRRALPMHEAILCVRPIREVWVWDTDAEAAEQFCAEMSRNMGLPVHRAATATAAVRDADIICAATTARTPVFRDCDLKPGVHINALES